MRRPALLLLGLCTLALDLRSQPVYPSPVDVAFSRDGRRFAVCDRTANLLHLGGPDTGLHPEPLALPGSPLALVGSPEEDDVFYVSIEQPNKILEIDTSAPRITREWETGSRPRGLAISPRHDRLLAALPDTDEVLLIHLTDSARPSRIAVRREPRWIAVTPGHNTALVANFLPAESLQDPNIAASVSILDIAQAKITGTIRLPTGSTLARQIAVSPDGRWGYVAHVLARFAVPASQLDRAWINSNALTILDLGSRRVHATLLLDQFMNGAAEPWGVALSPDGATAWVALAGVHQITRIDLTRVHALLDGKASPPRGSSARPTIWQEIAKDPLHRERLADDLDALTQAEALDRWTIPARGPRGIAYSARTDLLAVTSYFTGEVLLIDPNSGRPRLIVSLGPQPATDPVRLGESIFHDATYSMQHWLSCSTCHPEGRVDGLNWDLMNDGITNPKNTKSLVWSDRTPPSMIRGVRADMEAASLAGFRYTQNVEPQPHEIFAVQAYIRSLRPQPPPDGRDPQNDSSASILGQQIFEREEVGCATCHPRPLFTDLKSHDVGTGRNAEIGTQFDTPTLVETWRTAPYLHHGLANSLDDVLTRFNPDDRHGVTSHLSPPERQALVRYLNSL